MGTVLGHLPISRVVSMGRCNTCLKSYRVLADLHSALLEDFAAELLELHF